MCCQWQHSGGSTAGVCSGSGDNMCLQVTNNYALYRNTRHMHCAACLLKYRAA